jgi:hypothetical protein
MDDVHEKKFDGLHSSAISYFIDVNLFFAANVLDYYHYHDDQKRDNKHDSWHRMDDGTHKKRYVQVFLGHFLFANNFI